MQLQQYTRMYVCMYIVCAYWNILLQLNSSRINIGRKKKQKKPALHVSYNVYGSP